MGARKTGRSFEVWLWPLALAVFFSPILTTGLFQDDIVLAVLAYGKPDSFAVISASISKWVHGWLEIGRFFPVSSALSIVMFHFFDFNNPFGYHLLQVVLIICCCGFFAAEFIQGREKRMAALLLFCAMSAIYESGHDPYLAYHLVMPVFTLLFFGAVALFERHLETGKTWIGLVALVLYLSALATYEIAYPLILVFFVQLLALRPKCARTWLHLCLLGAVLFGFQIWLRMQAKEIAYEGIAIGLGPREVIRTFVVQSFSCIPLAQQIGSVFIRIRELPGGSVFNAFLVLGIFAGWAVLSGYLVHRFFRNRSRENVLLLIGLIVWLAPALVIAISTKYQEGLWWGSGYLPRFIQSFGLAVVCLGLAGRLLTSRWALAALAALALVTFALNVRTVRTLNRDFAAARLLLNVIEDRQFLADLGCTRLFVERTYVHSSDQLGALNPAVVVNDGDAPADGEHVLLIHPGNPGCEWAVVGVYRDGSVHDPVLLLGTRHEARAAGGAVASLKEWSVSPLGWAEIDYHGMVQAVSSGRLPAQ